jgi:hypothetical protein
MVFEQIIYHLDPGQGTKETFESNEVEGLDVCNMCGNQSAWYTSEIHAPSGCHSDERRITRYWCDNCTSHLFVDPCNTWSGTPNDELHRKPN